MIYAVYALALFNLFGPPPSHGENFERHKLDNWTYIVGVDRFTRNQRCILTGPGVTYSRGAAVFTFSEKTDTSNAWYKVDSGEAVAWRPLALELAKLGALPTGDNLSNPSEGKVAIPVGDLAHGSYVEIRPNYRTDARRFDLRDLWRALAAAKEDGCDPDRSY